MHDTHINSFNETNRMLTKEGKLDSAYGHTIRGKVGYSIWTKLMTN